ncbi:MAG: hypothetical protein KJ667_02230 [Alphaproteobacteria bacterium]|nr:hypothetical protein [Alphaproteobacteria bacterium]
MSTDLDGTYNVSSTSSYGGPLERKSDGVTTIKDGKTARLDDNSVMWTSTFTILSDTEVEMISVADPSKAKADFALTRPDGTPTREIVTYRSVLKLARKGDKIQMSGQIEYGNDVIFLTMCKTGV